MTLDLKWRDLEYKISDSILKVIEEDFKFDKVMPVQNAVIPNFCKNYDVAVEASTGSGKTLAFLIPIFEKLLKEQDKFEPESIKALIITPTRELAFQIYNVALKLHKGLGKIGVKCIFGKIAEQEAKDGQKSKEICEGGQNIFIVTPGRLAEMLKEGVKDFKDIDFLILDEADRLLDSNFHQEIKNIVLQLPKQRRTGLFSATLSSQKQDELIKVGLRNPVIVRLTKSDNEWGNKHEVPITLNNYHLLVKKRLDKLVFLAQYVIENRDHKIIVFFNTCDSVDFYFKLFLRYIGDRNQIFKGYYMGKIHGEIKQQKRMSVFKEFGEKESGLLFATDVIARGIDFEKVDSIIQIDLPQDPNFYIHRIGRTARQGKQGRAIVVVDESEAPYIDYLKEKLPNLEPYTGHPGADLKEGAITKFERTARALMLTDKDYILKSSRGFVSFIRSFKEHKLNFILKFKNLDFFDTARSFFLFKLPVLREFLDLKLDQPLATEEELEKFEKVGFSDKNQEKMIKTKIEEAIEKRQSMLEKRVSVKEKLQKEQEKKKIRSKAERGRAKKRGELKEFEELKEEMKLEKKLKHHRIDEKDYEEKISKIDKKHEYSVKSKKK